jgi:uncharacterized protein (DUF2267 family)
MDDFLAHIKEKYRADGLFDAEKTARAVFTVLKRKITEGEIQDVKGMMPDDLKSLWGGPT